RRRTGNPTKPKTPRARPCLTDNKRLLALLAYQRNLFTVHSLSPWVRILSRLRIKHQPPALQLMSHVAVSESPDDIDTPGELISVRSIIVPAVDAENSPC